MYCTKYMPGGHISGLHFHYTTEIRKRNKKQAGKREKRLGTNDALRKLSSFFLQLPLYSFIAELAELADPRHRLFSSWSLGSTPAVHADS